ncbi:hypothetical protein DYH09_26755 [bacterium CPR1]|nr:hypothetical protein [bacterium CPR1]
MQLMSWLMILAGVSSLLGALSPSPWLWRHRRTRPLVPLLGQTGARLLFVALCVVLIAAGILTLH